MRFFPTKSERKSPKRFTVAVIPPSVASTAMDVLGPLNPTNSPATFGDFASTKFLPIMNKMVKDGGNCLVWPGLMPKTRCIHFMLTTTLPLLFSAPPVVQLLAGALTTRRTHAFVYVANSLSDYEAGLAPDSDIWIVAQRTEGLRNGAYEFLRRQGVIFAAPGDEWTLIPTKVQLDEYTMALIREPITSCTSWSAEGGLTQIGQPPVPGNTVTVAVGWDDWSRAVGAPREFTAATTSVDGAEGLMFYRQCEYGHDRRMINWAPAPTTGLPRRGWSASKGDWPTVCTGQTSFGAKPCCTHHGTGGSYPAAPLIPWQGITAPVAGCTVTPLTTCALAPDTNADSAAYPYGANDYSSWMPGSGVRMAAEFWRDVIAARQGAVGPLNPISRGVSSEPTDGGDVCQGDHCVNLLRKGPYKNELRAEVTGLKNTGTSPKVTGSGIIGTGSDFKIKYLSPTTMQVSLDGGDNYTVGPLPIPIGSTYVVPTTSSFVLTFKPGTYVAGDTVCVADASDGDKTFHMTMCAQQYFHHHWQNAPQYEPSIGVASYNTHAQPPSIPIDPLSSVTVVDTSGQTYAGSYTAIEFLLLWIARRDANTRGRHKLGLSTFDRTDSEAWGTYRYPTARLAYAKFEVLAEHELDYFSAQTGGSALSIALHFFMHGLQSWDAGLDVEALIDKWFSVHGPAAPALRVLFERWESNGGFHYGSEELALSYRDVKAAQDALDAAVDPVDPDYLEEDARSKIQQRVNCWKDYIEWLRVSGNVRQWEYAFKKDPSIPNQNSFAAALDEMFVWGWRIYGTRAAHTDQSLQALRFRRLMDWPGGYSGSQNIYAPDFTKTGTPDADATIVRIECTRADVVVDGVFITFAQFRASKDAGLNWSATQTRPSAGAFALTFFGRTYTFASQSYVTTYAWADFVALDKKWKESDPSAGPVGGWGSMDGPSGPPTVELTALVATRIAQYVPTTGITRRLAHSDNYQVLTPNSDTSLVFGAFFSVTQYHSYLVHLDGTPQPFGVAVSSGGAGPDQPLRIRVMDLAGNQVAEYDVPRAGNDRTQPPLETTVMLTQPAGFYIVKVQVPRCSDTVRIHVQKKLPCCWINDPPEAEMTNANVFATATRHYFYVPPGQSKIVLYLKTQPALRFFDKNGTLVATTNQTSDPFRWECVVPGGQDNAVWSFDGMRGDDNTARVHFLNCPNLIAWDPKQIIVPIEFLSP